MPFVHETRGKLIPREPGLDRRIRLTEEQKKEIAGAEGFSVRELAELFGVSRRTIQFIRNPESKAQNLARRDERGGWRSYYDAEKHKVRLREHRKHKRELDLQGLLIEKGKDDV